MNPFTESTVARPAGETWTRPSDEAELNDPKRLDGAPSTGRAGGKTRFLRRPRPERMVRRRTRGQVVGKVKQTWARGFAGIMGVVMTGALASAWAVNVNSATAQQLESITGSGPKTAQVIIDERIRGG